MYINRIYVQKVEACPPLTGRCTSFLSWNLSKHDLLPLWVVWKGSSVLGAAKSPPDGRGRKEKGAIAKPSWLHGTRKSELI